jgi:beta-hydroxylase
MGKYSLVGDKPIMDNDQFAWVGLLEENWEMIRKELMTIFPHRSELPNLQDIQREQIVLNQDDNWKTFFLYGFGIKASLNCEACPYTSSVLGKIPGIQTAFFSLLSPHKHIPAHKGIFKGLLRSHLGLLVPGEGKQCRMRIENQFIYWQEGKVVVFDDTREHEVWNNSDQVRVVLLLDVVRPYKGFMAWINKGIIRLIGNSSYVKEAMHNHLRWEKKFHTTRIPHNVEV